MEQDNPFLKALSTPAPASVADNGDQSASDNPAPASVADNGDQSASDNPFLKALESPSDQAAPDQPTDNTDYGSKDWLTDVLPATAKLAPKQFVDTLNGIGSSILHPLDTLNDIGKIGSGLVSKAEGYAGMQQDTGEKDKTEAMINAIGQHYKDVYGGLLSGDTSGLKKELMTKGPIEPLMDAATVLSGGEMALAKAPGMLGKVGALSGNLASAIDPVQNALRIANVVAKPVTWPIGKVAPFLQAGATGVPKQFVDLANIASTTDNPALKEAFMRGMRSDVQAETVNKSVQALDSLATENSKSYVAAKTALGAEPPAVPLDWTSLNDAIDAQEKTTRTVTPSGNVHINNPEADAMLQQVKNDVRGTPATENSPGTVGLMNDPGFQNLQFFDNYKQQIGRMTYGKNLPSATKNVMEQLYGGMKSAITNSYPDYQSLMENSQADINQMKDLVSQMGTSKLPMSKKFAKLNLSGRKPDDTLINVLGEQDPTLPFLLAGHAFHQVLPNRLQTALEAAAAVFTALPHPYLLSGVVATSPRAMGELNQVVGKARALPNKLNLNRGLALEQGSTATQGYAKGGSVINPEKEAERLIAEAGKARKSHGKTTSPLMNLPDEAITKALAIANESI